MFTELEKNPRTKRVVLVHRNELFCEALALLLEWKTEFKETVQAGSFAEARQALDGPEGKADLAIVDLDLPEWHGHEPIGDLLGESDVPVLALTTSQDSEWRDKASEAGAGEVFNTTVSAAEIISAVRRLGGE